MKDAQSAQWEEIKNELQRLYPKRNPVMSWDWRTVAARLTEGATADELKAAVRRYATWCDASNVTGTRYVMFPGKFFAEGSEAPWRQPFMVAGGKSAPGAPPLSEEQKIEMSADKEAHRLGAPLRQAGETAAAYSDRIRKSVIREAIERMAINANGRR